MLLVVIAEDSNAWLLITLTLSPIDTDDRDKQRANGRLSIVITIRGIVALIREEHRSRALLRIVVTLLARVMCSWLSQQVPRERISLVHSMAEGADFRDGLRVEMTGLVEG
jgi:hypothetical protein